MSHIHGKCKYGMACTGFGTLECMLIMYIEYINDDMITASFPRLIQESTAIETNKNIFATSSYPSKTSTVQTYQNPLKEKFAPYKYTEEYPEISQFYRDIFYTLS